ncbi:ketopantoate hydroxymethyltransferase [Salsuginibacillus halophilus]|uniref:3-methyl-2-oxobutanoate hydroxymethyltransferase n=1 Tax=Salsuginibacillus halophilus TaxID=517424 RepID=A0A2P8HWC0_9BACI|nr:3-methyl-2-oxobutanoate hydroxymethyltransferase [Salsuginibacillus halophilus]PSL50531.1 ketopantoate hydroxymethyltransferase [Salsuginibacillus halophilus]
MHTTVTLKAMKENNEKIAMMTAYDAPGAAVVETGGIDLILVGDSAGMVIHGYDSTVPVTLEDMLLHTRAVRRGAKDTFVVTDIPFLLAHMDIAESMRAAYRVMQEGGAHAIKLEGASQEVMQLTERLTAGGVPVMGHLGLTPQHANVLGGFKVQAKEEEAARQLLKDAEALEAAGAFAIVLECIPAQLAEQVTKHVSVPVIGIGAGAHTDGQVLVFHDAVGFGTGHVPKFVKTYANIYETVAEAVETYVTDVKSGAFPEKKHTFQMNEDVAGRLYKGVES